MKLTDGRYMYQIADAQLRMIDPLSGSGQDTFYCGGGKTRLVRVVRRKRRGVQRWSEPHNLEDQRMGSVTVSQPTDSVRDAPEAATVSQVSSHSWTTLLAPTSS